MILKQYRYQIELLLKSKIYVVLLLIVATLSYGFTITNYSIGIDDAAFDRYFSGPHNLVAGRWGAFFLYNILGIKEFTPFWLDFLCVMILTVIVLVWSAFFKKNFEDKFSNISCLIFSAVFLSFPIINEAFIFQSSFLGIVVSTLAMTVALILMYENYFYIKSLKKYIFLILCLPFFISMYESCCQFFVVGCLFIAFLKYFYYDTNVKEVFLFIIYNAVIMLLAIEINYAICSAYGTFFNGITVVADKSIALFGYFKYINIFLKRFAEIFTIDLFLYTSVRIFLIVAIISIVYVFFISLKLHKYFGIVIYLFAFFSNFILFVLKYEILYRTCMSWSLFVALAVAIIYNEFRSSKKGEIIIEIMIMFLLLFQTRELNQEFFNDEKRHQIEINSAYKIANKIEQECSNINKPLIIFGNGGGAYNKYGNQTNGKSVILWGINAFNNTGIELVRYFNLLGYDFILPNELDVENAKKILSEEINEQEELIVVKEYDNFIILILNNKMDTYKFN